MGTTPNGFMEPMIYCGFILLTAMGLLYLIPPIIKHIFKKTPPGIISLTYTLLTAITLILSIFLISEEPFVQLLTEITQLIFIEGKVEIQLKIMIIAFFLSFYFLLANLMRSYFNLHRIEEPESYDVFANFLSTLQRKKRWIEFLLRVPIFLIIIYVEVKVVSLNFVIESNTPLMSRVAEFHNTFQSIWQLAILFYGILIVWDIFLLNEMDQNEDTSRRVIKLQALPVHLCGMLVAIALTLSNYISDLANVFAPIALFLSLIGIVLLLISMFEDCKLIKKAFQPTTIS